MVMLDGGDNETSSLWTDFDFICKGENIDTVTYSSDSYYFAPISKNEYSEIDSEYIVDTPDKSDISHSYTVNYDEQSTKPYQIMYADGTTESRDIVLNGLTLTNSDDGSLTINADNVTATVK